MRRPRTYILADKKPVLCVDIDAWATWMEKAVSECVVGFESEAGVTVETAFVGCHKDNSDPPCLFETTVRGGRLDGHMRRYSSWDDAEAGHDEMLKRAWSPPSSKPRDGLSDALGDRV